MRHRFIRGVSEYNNSSYDGAETIAEGVVAIRNNEIVPQEIRNLVEEYVKW